MKAITGKTVLTGLLGSPVSHSKSPMMHNEAFSQLGLDYVYLAFDVGTEQLKTVTDGMRHMNVRGFNVTMPNKTAMCELCDELSPSAEIIGAINTVVNENGRFVGHSTDGIGLIHALQTDGFDICDKKITLLGAGGAATSIFVQAAFQGALEISIFSRPGLSFDRAAEKIQLLSTLVNCKINLFTFGDESILRKEISESSLLINATSVGMAPNVEMSIIDDSSIFHKDLFVADIIYNPLETKFLELAREAGCRTQNGLKMLLYQGAEAFRLWTGMDMPIDIIQEKYFSE